MILVNLVFLVMLVILVILVKNHKGGSRYLKVVNPFVWHQSR